MVGLQTLDLAIGVRVPASQPKSFKHFRTAREIVDAQPGPALSDNSTEHKRGDKAFIWS